MNVRPSPRSVPTRKKVLGGPRLPGATLDWGVPRSKRFRTRVVIAPHVAHGRDTPPDVPARSPSFACIGKATMPYPPPAAMTPSPNAAIGAGGPPATEGFPTFESIGVRPLINCAHADSARPQTLMRSHLPLWLTASAAGFATGRGSYTAMSGSLTLPEVKAAMDAAGTVRHQQLSVPLVRPPAERAPRLKHEVGGVSDRRATSKSANFKSQSASASGRSWAQSMAW